MHRLIRGNTMTPTFTRGPGEALGVFTLECAMDELAYAVGIDPVELRLRNHAPTDDRGHAWSSDGLPECLRARGASASAGRRATRPRARARDGDWLIGTGMAAAAYPIAFFMPEQRARARLHADGSAVVQMAAVEFGTGALTMATQVAADALGLEPGRRASSRPATATCPNASSAVGSAGRGDDQLRRARRGVARCARSSSRWRSAIRRRRCTAPTRARSIVAGGVADARPRGARGPLRRHPRPQPHGRRRGDRAAGARPRSTARTGCSTFGAQFAEVAVDPDLGLVRVRRLAGAFAPGRVLNPLLARSQLMGGMLWGMGQALLEGNAIDPRTGRWAASNLAEYLVPVNADAPDVNVEFVEVDDELVGPLGAKGVGEIGQVGVAAAIANAVFHATGRRVRELPIAPELVMDPPNDRAPGAAADLGARAGWQRFGPRLGLRGLGLVVPIAVLLAVGAGGPESSLLVLGPLVTYSLPLIALVAFWWEDWPGHAAARQLVGLGGHRADRGRGAVVLTARRAGRSPAGSTCARSSTRPGGRVPTFPATLPLGGRRVRGHAPGHAGRRGLAAAAPARASSAVRSRWCCRGRSRSPLPRRSWRSTPPPGSGVSARSGPVAGRGLRRRARLHRRMAGAVLRRSGADWPTSPVVSRAARLPCAHALVHRRRAADLCRARLALEPSTVTAAAGCFVAAGTARRHALRGRHARGLAAALLLAAALFAALSRARRRVHLHARATAEDWVAHASLNALAVSTILHVAVGRRWPFA